MIEDNNRKRLFSIASLSAQYCLALEKAGETEKKEFVEKILDYLPKIYWEFSDLDIENASLEEDFGFLPEYVEEEQYDTVRRNVEAIMGEDDVFLETFEEDMKYSDTPVAASVSELLADIFQPLYNFISVIKESEGDNLEIAYCECKDNFKNYWSQSLCNVMRALNRVRYNPETI